MIELSSIEEIALRLATDWYHAAKFRSDVKADLKSYYEGYRDAMVFCQGNNYNLDLKNLKTKNIMAEFSKQYCKNHNMGFDGDFDIFNEFSLLQNGYYVSIVCEGYGFIALRKDENGDNFFGFYDDEDIKWVSESDFIF